MTQAPSLVLLLFSLLNQVWLSSTPWTVACQAPLYMEFSRKEYWTGLPFPSPGDLPHSEIKLASPELAGRFFTTEPPGKPQSLVGEKIPQVTHHGQNFFLKLKKKKEEETVNRLNGKNVDKSKFFSVSSSLFLNFWAHTQTYTGDAMKVLHSKCQQIWKIQQWPQDWKRSAFTPASKKGDAKECSTIAQLHSSHTLVK